MEQEITEHPLHAALLAAIVQATRGKGVRHGGDATPFLEQPWAHYAQMHGRGFLTGQAAKKLEEAASRGLTGEEFEREVLGAIVYCGMSILYERALHPVAPACEQEGPIATRVMGPAAYILNID